MLQGDSSPFDSSPIASNSPRLYWQNRDPASPTRSNAENRNPLSDRGGSPSPKKRSSIENLKLASRVKNSSMFAREHKQEYDPTSSPVIERPLATGRPLSVQVQGNAYGARGLEGLHKEMAVDCKKTLGNTPLRSPTKMDEISEVSKSPSKSLGSPAKSSLSSKSRYAQIHQPFDPEHGIWSDEDESYAEHELPPGKSLHRHAKSVTFETAPPQVNEYEMTTPEPSSVASESRDGSYDSVENNDDEDESFDRGSMERDDSFDASLEDAEKTPVVLPEDWRFMSPAVANDDLAARVENPFDGEDSSPAPTAPPSSAIDARLSPTRTDSANSNGERRPLPPLPALGMPIFPRTRSDSNNSLSATAERVSSAQRKAPSPPRPASISKSEIQGMGGCSMSLEDRLRLMMIQDGERSQKPAQQQEETNQVSASSSETKEQEHDVPVQADVVENDDVADLGEYKLPPRISRESILRKVKGQSKRSDEHEDEYSFATSPGPGRDSFSRFSNIDPDTPLPSMETEITEEEVVIKEEDNGEDSEVDVYSIPDLYSQQLHAESYMTAIEKLEAFKESEAAAHQNDDDDASHYSVDHKTDENQGFQVQMPSNDDESALTPRALTPNQTGQTLGRSNSHRMSLPQFAALLGEHDFGLGMDSFMTPSPPIDQEPMKSSIASDQPWASSPSPVEEHAATTTPPADPVQLEKHFNRPVTPQQQLEPPRFPGQANETDEPRTPESVVRHPVAESPVPDSPGVPEPVATIKAPGSKLKTRPSVTPADIQAMAEVRRQVSIEIPAIPKIPERHQSRPSVVAESDEPLPDPEGETNSVQDSEGKDAQRQVKRKSSLLPLEIPVERDDGLGFGIESEFDRVIEAQKVVFRFFSPLNQLPSHAPKAMSNAWLDKASNQFSKAVLTKLLAHRKAILCGRIPKS